MEIAMSANNPAAASYSPDGIVRVNRQGAIAIRMTALAVMLLPLLGFIEAVRLWMTGYAAATEWTLFGVMYIVHMGGISMGFHRMLSHRAFTTLSAVRISFLIFGSMAAQGPLLYWVATHRRHHAYSDRPGDPHSPQLYGKDWKSKAAGLWHAHMPWMLSEEISQWNYFAKDIIGDRQLLFFHRTYLWWVLLGLALPAVLGGLIHDSWAGAWSGFIFGGLARMFLANQFAWCVGSVCHMFGGRPFETRDHSTNNWSVAVLTFGEGLQNNHHAFPWWYRHGVHWWEPDLSGWILTLLGKLGVVKDLKSPSSDAIRRLRRRTPV
jgi:stearoyl-CoA desaturase (delta-9 desaturase)